MTTREVDYDHIQQTMVALGEFLARRGFDKPLSDIEGNGRIGEAVRDPRDADSLKAIAKYMKGLAAELKSEAAKAQASKGFVPPELLACMKGLDEAWQNFRGAIK